MSRSAQRLSRRGGAISLQPSPDRVVRTGSGSDRVSLSRPRRSRPTICYVAFTESVQPRYKALRRFSVIEILRTKGVCERLFLNVHTIQRRDENRYGAERQS